MICYLSGVLLQKHLEFVILDVHGVGYEVIVPASTLCVLPREGEHAQVYVSTYVREDAFRLYGFNTIFDKNVFEALLGVSGIGPKVALALLGAADGFAVCDLIIGNQTERLTNIPGVGTKTAERLVLELKSKCQKLIVRYREQQLFSTADTQLPRNIQKNQSLRATALLEDLNSALANMGYKEKQVAPLVEVVQKRLHAGEELAFEDILKDSLKKLSEKILK